MQHVPTLLRRELAAYFLNPIAYLVLLGFQVIAWFSFAQLVGLLSHFQNEYSGLRDPMNAYVAGSTVFWFSMPVAVAVLTMRLIAEERRNGTIETLLTVPVTETEIVIAKWMSGVVMLAITMVPFALYLPFLRHYGHYEFDLGPLVSLGIGLTTLVMMFVAIGLFMSSITKHQIVASIGTIVILFCFVFVLWNFYQIAVERRSSWAEAAQFMSVVVQMHALGSGEFDIRFVAMHLSVATFMLFLTVKILEFRQGK